jgi:DNA-binding CsgD family transcriptional regulator
MIYLCIVFSLFNFLQEIFPPINFKSLEKFEFFFDSSSVPKNLILNFEIDNTVQEKDLKRIFSCKDLLKEAYHQFEIRIFKFDFSFTFFSEYNYRLRKSILPGSFIAESKVRDDLILRDLVNQDSLLTVKLNNDIETVQSKLGGNYIFMIFLIFLFTSFLLFIRKIFKSQVARFDELVIEKEKLVSCINKQEIQIRNLQIELEQYSKLIFTKDADQLRQNKIYSEVLLKLSVVGESLTGDKKDLIREIYSSIYKLNNEKSLEKFESTFSKMDLSFIRVLSMKFPELTKSERRLCAFVRLNFSDKEIHLLTGQSINSIKVAKSRLKKKLGLFSSDDLYQYFSDLADG